LSWETSTRASWTKDGLGLWYGPSPVRRSSAHTMKARFGISSGHRPVTQSTSLTSLARSSRRSWSALPTMTGLSRTLLFGMVRTFRSTTSRTSARRQPLRSLLPRTQSPLPTLYSSTTVRALFRQMLAACSALSSTASGAGA